MSVAVVGHTEWVTFARVDDVPRPGAIVHAEEVLDVPAGGGPVAAVQLSRLASAGASCAFFTALGDDELGHRCHTRLVEFGLDVHVAWRSEPQRRAFCHVDADGERTITVLGSRLGPRGDDDLPWDRVAQAEAVYFCAGDEGALRASRRAGVLVATLREAATLERCGLRLDAVVGSSRDPGEVLPDMQPAPAHVVWTDGAEGGTLDDVRYAAAVPPGPVIDAYGAGDCFAAGLTSGLGRGSAIEEAVALGARCGAAVITGLGPYRSMAS